VTRNASKFEKIVYRASQRDLISAGSSMKEFFNSHSPFRKLPGWQRSFMIMPDNVNLGFSKPSPYFALELIARIDARLADNKPHRR
jgi:hypothetical protein